MNSQRVYRYALVLVFALGAAAAQAQMAGHGVHPPMPDQKFYLYCRLAVGDEPRLIETELDIAAPTRPGELDQTISLPEPWPPLRVVEYLPRGELVQRVEPAPESAGKPAIELAVEGPTQSYKFWLIAGDAEHNRLTSLVGTWRYMSVATPRERDELFQQFKDELTRAPTVLVARTNGDGAQTVPAEAGVDRKLDELGCTVRVTAFYPDFSMDRETGKPANQSDKRRNPAALVELEQDDRKEERWVFAKFPDFKSDRADRLPFRVVLDCPIESTRTTPDCMIVTLEKRALEAWTRQAAETKSVSIKSDERVAVPGSQYTFAVAQFVPSGRLIEEYRASEKKGAVAALKLTSGEISQWLEPGKERTWALKPGLLVVSFGPRQVMTTQPAHGTSP
jgi:hypothetical protein